MDSITDSMDMYLSKLLEVVKDREAWRATMHVGSKRVRHNLVTGSTHANLFIIDGQKKLYFTD